MEEFYAVKRLIQGKRYMPVTWLYLAHEDLEPDLCLNFLVNRGREDLIAFVRVRGFEEALEHFV